MKNILLLITTLSCLTASAQKIEKFYDALWKPCPANQARFYSQITQTDSGWLRRDYFVGTATLQMSGLYEDSSTKILNGYFRYNYANGIPKNMGRYVHNKREGLWLGYHVNGMIMDSTMYVDGKPSGTSFGWHSNGYMADSIVYSSNGTAVKVTWATNGSPSSAGHLVNGKLHGPWQFFHNNGKLAAREMYDSGKLVSGTYFDYSGAPEAKASKDRGATFRGGLKAWKRFVLRHISFPSKYKIVNNDQVTVVVAATIDENGNLLDPYVMVPFHKDFDKIALSIFKKSPKWLPAIKHNRAVKAGKAQPITFVRRN